jgi:hypothetical protein
MVVDPFGALTTISKSGADACALAATHPALNNVTTTMPRTIMRVT